MIYSGEFAKIWFKLNRDLKTHLDQTLGPNLTEAQLIVIEYVLAQEQVKPSDLLDHLATTPAAITTLLDRMEKNGLIERKRDEQDRRIVWIHLTELGLREGKRGMEIRNEYIQAFLSRISAHNQQLLIYLLGKLTA